MSYVHVPCNGVTVKGRQCRRMLTWRSDDLENAYCGTHRPRTMFGPAALTAQGQAALAAHPSANPAPKLRLIKGGRYGE